MNREKRIEKLIISIKKSQDRAERRWIKSDAEWDRWLKETTDLAQTAMKMMKDNERAQRQRDRERARRKPKNTNPQA